MGQSLGSVDNDAGEANPRIQAINSQDNLDRVDNQKQSTAKSI